MLIPCRWGQAPFSASALLLACVSIVVMGCAAEQGPRTTTSPGDESGMISAPLTLQEEPPASPPSVRIGSSESSGEEQPTGQLLFADGFATGNVTASASTPPKWPPVQSTPVSPARVSLGTPLRPRAVTVKVFEAVPNGVGEPQAAPVAVQDCWLQELDSPGCDLQMKNSEMTIRMPRLDPGSYSITVYVAWPNPTSERIDTTAASWLFSLQVTGS